MKRLPYLLILAVLIAGVAASSIRNVPRIAEARMPMVVMSGSTPVAGGGGDSALYTAATAVWRFNNDATDEKGSHDAANSGDPTYSTSSPPEGTHFISYDGTGDYSTVTDHDDFNTEGGDWSISMLFNHYVNDELNLLTKFGSYTGIRIYTTYEDPNPHLNITVDNDDSGGLYQDLGEVTHSTWWHLVVTYDASETSAEVTVWLSTMAGTFGDTINGTTYDSGADAGNNAVDLVFGDTGGDIDMDEIAIWVGTEITATDAEDLYDNPGAW
jgi:hypothetical protein